MEIIRLVSYILQYVEKMHPNLNKASSMHPISFGHVQDFPCVRALC
jgi:hypothetical protein